MEGEEPKLQRLLSGLHFTGNEACVVPHLSQLTPQAPREPFLFSSS